MPGKAKTTSGERNLIILNKENFKSKFFHFFFFFFFDNGNLFFISDHQHPTQKTLEQLAKVHVWIVLEQLLQQQKRLPNFSLKILQKKRSRKLQEEKRKLKPLKNLRRKKQPLQPNQKLRKKLNLQNPRQRNLHPKSLLPRAHQRAKQLSREQEQWPLLQMRAKTFSNTNRNTEEVLDVAKELLLPRNPKPKM